MISLEEYKKQLQKFFKDENLDKFYEIAQEKWNIIQLFQDLEIQQKKDDPRKRGLGTFEKKYLCLLLAEKKPEEIQQLANYSKTTIQSTPTKGGLYELLRKLTEQEIKDWRDVIIALVNKGYRKSSGSDSSNNTSLEKEAIVIIKCDEEISEALLTRLENNMKEIIGVNKLMLNHLEKGCIKTYWQGSQSTCEQIYALHQQGLLSERLGVSILEVRIISIKQKINLTQWFTGIFTETWQNVEQLLTPQQLGIAHFSEQIKRAKRIDLRIDLITHSVVLVVNIDRENINQIVVTLQLYPTDGNKTLPEGLKLIVLAAGEVFQEIIARSADQLMQCRFDAELGDEFTLELRLGEAIIKEDFEL